MNKKRNILILQNIDTLLLIAIIALLMGGMVMMTSASMSFAENKQGVPFYYLYKQGIAACLGLFAGFLFFLKPTDYWEKLGILTPLIAIGLLCLVFIPGIGVEANGAYRWIKLGPLPNIQVVDPARLLLLIYIAGYCFRQKKQVEMNFISLIKLMIFVLPTCILLLFQPDFGSTVVLLGIVAASFFVAGFKFRYIIVLITALALAFWALIVTFPYRLTRVTSFLDPFKDAFGAGYQLANSEIAIGQGGWLGVGLGESVQKLGFLPEAHTDFIFAIIAEEFGMIGVLLLIGIYGLIIWRIFFISLKAIKNNRVFQGYLSFSIGIWITAQVIIHIGVNMGIMPTKGLILPLVSYGSSNMVITLITLAIVLRIGCENPRTKENKKIGG